MMRSRINADVGLGEYASSYTVQHNDRPSKSAGQEITTHAHNLEITGSDIAKKGHGDIAPQTAVLPQTNSFEIFLT